MGSLRITPGSRRDHVGISDHLSAITRPPLPYPLLPWLLLLHAYQLWLRVLMAASGAACPSRGWHLVLRRNFVAHVSIAAGTLADIATTAMPQTASPKRSGARVSTHPSAAHVTTARMHVTSAVESHGPRLPHGPLGSQLRQPAAQQPHCSQQTTVLQPAAASCSSQRRKWCSVPEARRG